MAQYRGKDEKNISYSLAFRRAASMGDFDQVKWLVEFGVTINLPGAESRRTALHLAVINDRINIAVFCLTLSLDRSLKDKDGKTAEDYVKPKSAMKKVFHFFNDLEEKGLPPVRPYLSDDIVGYLPGIK